MHLKVSSAKHWPFYPGHHMLNTGTSVSGVPWWLTCNGWATMSLENNVFLYLVLHYLYAYSWYLLIPNKQSWCLVESNNIIIEHTCNDRSYLATEISPYLFSLDINSSPSSVAYMRQSGQHWFRWWLVAYSAPSHSLNQCWLIVNWTLRNKLRWNSNQNTEVFIHENASE